MNTGNSLENVAVPTTIALLFASTTGNIMPALQSQLPDMGSINPPMSNIRSIEKRAAAPASPKEMLLDLQKQTGLTWSQIARLFGVSRRSVHLWASGKPMRSKHEERLCHLVAVIRPYFADGSEQTKAALLDTRDGTSLFHKLVNENSGFQRTIVPAYSARELLEA